MKGDTFRDKAIIVTGASSGIGRALAYRLADQGAWLVLAARGAERLEAIAGECRERGGQALVVPTDVGVEAQCKRLVEHTIEHYGRLDMLVNNAGIGVVALFEELPGLELFHSVIDVNFWGNVYCAYHALPHLKQSGGRIVAVSSLGGKIAIPGNTSYVASKHALQGFYDALRLEVARSGVSVTVISPYWVVTEFHERLLNREGTPAGEAGRSIYTRRMMTADACARIVLKAAARRKREVIMSPGGMTLGLKLIAPGMLDKLIIALVMRPLIRRMKKTSV